MLTLVGVRGASAKISDLVNDGTGKIAKLTHSGFVTRWDSLDEAYR